MIKSNRVRGGFSLVELLIVIVIVAVLGVISFVAIQRTKIRTMNEKMLDDLVAIANALEDYRRDHQGLFPIPTSESNQNVLCFYSDATYADCEDAGVAFVQGMIDNNLLTKRYLREVPTDPRTGSRYVYGVSYPDAKFYQVAGIYESDIGAFEARTVENLAKGFQLPSLIRAYDGPNFVIDRESNLPYPSDHLALTGTLDNVQGNVTVDGTIAVNQMVVREGQIISTEGDGEADLYFSDGSVTHIDPITILDLKSLKTEKNDKSGTITKILMNLTKGKIWSKVARLAQNSEFRVETTSAIAGVRGTEFGVDWGGNVKIKAGKVWRKAKASGLSADEIWTTITTPSDDSFDFNDSSSVAGLDDYLPYYKTIPLTANHRPHILSIKPNGTTSSSVTVRNVNFFANLVNAQLALTNPDKMRRVQATRLAVYKSAEPTPDNANFPYELLTTPAPLDISGQQTGPYTLNLSTQSIGSLYLRFEYLEKDEQEVLKIVRASGLAPLPPTDGKTELDEKALYPNLVPLESGFSLDVGSDIVSLKKDPNTGDYAPSDLSVTLNCDSGAKYTLEARTSPGQATVAPAAVCDYSTAGPRACPAAAITVPIRSKGSCLVTATVTAADGAVSSLERTVRAVEEASSISFDPPRIADSADGRIVTLSWAGTSLRPFDYKFALFLKTGPGFSPVTLNKATSPQTFSGNVKKATSPETTFELPDGTYSWTVTMYELDSEQRRLGSLAFKEEEFTLSGASVPAAGFKILRGDGTELPDPVSLPMAAGDSATLTLEGPAPDASRTYSWNDTGKAGIVSPSSATTDIVIPAPGDAGSSVAHTITLTVRDAATRNVLATATRAVTATRPIAITGIEISLSPPGVYRGESATVAAKAHFDGGELILPASSFACEAAAASDAAGYSAPLADGVFQTSNQTPMDNHIVTCALSSAPDGYTLAATPLTAEATVAVLGCGDAKYDEGHEACDNGAAGGAPDGCDDATCTVTSGWSCDNTQGPTSVCTLTTQTICGDGKLEGAEACDDGNRTPSDGCAASCAVEDGWVCSGGSPTSASTCSRIQFAQLEHPYLAKGSQVPVATSPAALPARYTKKITARPATDTTTVLGPVSANFTALAEGTYRLEILDAAGAQVVTQDVRVCGYVGDGSQCWTLGTTGQSCGVTDAGAQGACEAIGLACSADTTWNDCGADGTCDTSFNTSSDDFSACVALASKLSPAVMVSNDATHRQILSSTDSATNAYAPYLINNYCKNRHSSFAASCSASPGTGRSRICKCQ